MFAGGSDYEAGPYNVTIPKGEMSAELCINITNDEVLEDDEVFIIRINKAADLVLMKPVETTVTILDDECKHKNNICQYSIYTVSYIITCLNLCMYMLVYSIIVNHRL